MKIKALIIDDEPIARAILENYVEKDGRIELLTSCKNAQEAMTFLSQHEVDLIFLDIEMPKVNGLEMLGALINPPLVIFTTAYREYAVEGFELNAIDYLVKPFAFERFLKAISRVSERIQEKRGLQSADFFFIKSDGKNIKIHYKDIVFVEAMNEYVRIHTNTQKIMAFQKMSYLEEKLPSQQFKRVHRSYIISLDKIEAIEGNQVFVAGQKIPVSRSYQECLFSQLKRFKL